MITLTLDPAGRSWLATTTGPAAAQLIDKLSKMHWEEERHGGGSHGE
jgi:hypothetical protein